MLPRGAGFPHRVEPPIVDRHERTRGDLLAQVESERLEDLEAAGAKPMGPLDVVGLIAGVGRR